MTRAAACGRGASGRRARDRGRRRAPARMTRLTTPACAEAFQTSTRRARVPPALRPSSGGSHPTAGGAAGRARAHGPAPRAPARGRGALGDGARGSGALGRARARSDAPGSARGAREVALRAHGIGEDAPDAVARYSAATRRPTRRALDVLLAVDNASKARRASLRPDDRAERNALGLASASLTMRARGDGDAADALERLHDALVAAPRRERLPAAPPRDDEAPGSLGDPGERAPPSLASDRPTRRIEARLERDAAVAVPTAEPDAVVALLLALAGSGDRARTPRRRRNRTETRRRREGAPSERPPPSASRPSRRCPRSGPADPLAPRARTRRKQTRRLRRSPSRPARASTPRPARRRSRRSDEEARRGPPGRNRNRTGLSSARSRGRGCPPPAEWTTRSAPRSSFRRAKTRSTRSTRSRSPSGGRTRRWTRCSCRTSRRSRSTPRWKRRPPARRRRRRGGDRPFLVGGSASFFSGGDGRRRRRGADGVGDGSEWLAAARDDASSRASRATLGWDAAPARAPPCGAFTSRGAAAIGRAYEGGAWHSKGGGVGAVRGARARGGDGGRGGARGAKSARRRRRRRRRAPRARALRGRLGTRDERSKRAAAASPPRAPRPPRGRSRPSRRRRGAAPRSKRRLSEAPRRRDRSFFFRRGTKPPR